MHHPVFYDDRTSDIGAINSVGLPIGRVAGSHRPTEEHVQAVANFRPNTGTNLVYAVTKRPSHLRSPPMENAWCSAVNSELQLSPAQPLMSVSVPGLDGHDLISQTSLLCFSVPMLLKPGLRHVVWCFEINRPW